MLSGRKIIVCVSGSIAAYKSAFLVRLLMKEGAEVKVVMTAAASRFITPLTFFHLTGKPVFEDLWAGEWTEHVHLGRWADLMVIAPATANTLANLCAGTCNNALQAVFLSATCPVLVAPAMDADMFHNQTVKRNLKQIEADGISVIQGVEGPHASGLSGPGRMAEPEEILTWIQKHFAKGPLSGKNVLISAGPTREAIDPVRYISNHSTGKMGLELALEAQKLGATVTLVLGPVNFPAPNGIHTIKVNSAQEMYEACTTAYPSAQITLMAAAVADYSPMDPKSEKIKKKEGELSLELIKTKDILLALGKEKQNTQFLVGFALETENALENARKKLSKKNLDLIVLNSLKDLGAGFGHDTNKVTLIDKAGRESALPLLSKADTAKEIFRKIIQDLEL